MKIGRISGLIAVSGMSATSVFGQATNATLPTQIPASVDRFYNLALGSNAMNSLQSYDYSISKANCDYPANWTGCFNTAIGELALASNNTGHENLAVGPFALYANTSGYYNTAVGNYALQSNKTGYSDVGVGTGALQFNTGNFNSGVGSYALWRNTTGNSNTALGYYALLRYQTPSNNTAIGAAAMIGSYTGTGSTKSFTINTGSGDTAIGSSALSVNTSGSNQTAVGYLALSMNTTGSGNVAEGYGALQNNLSGNDNTASGAMALSGNTTGLYNAAFGAQALYKSQSGLGNIGVGPFAGQNIVLGQLNIDIGSWGSADESNTIRIGIIPYHQKTYIAGIGTSAIPGGTPVVVDPATGQLGYGGSSERYKTDISSLGSATERLAQLRPVRFHIKTDPNGAIQYGLIAEEVDKVYPELVIHDQNGRIDGVRYDELAPMLLDQVQKDHQVMAVQAAEISALKEQVARISALEERLEAALRQLPSPDQLVAKR